MDKALKMLSDEHENILKVIDALLRECELLKRGKKIDANFFESAIDFIRNYADKFHHAKEEEILFSELSKDGVLVGCNPVQQMLYEHDLGRNFLSELQEGVKIGDKKNIIENVSGYASLLKEHIFKEDNILYPLADDVLSNDVKKKIFDRFVQTEKKFIKEKKKHTLFVEGLSSK